MKMVFSLIDFLSSVLSSSPVPDSPLEGCLGVSLDEGVDRTGISLGLGGAVEGWRSISFDSTTRDSLAEVCWDKGSDVGEGDVANIGGEWGGCVTPSARTPRLIPECKSMAEEN